MSAEQREAARDLSIILNNLDRVSEELYAQSTYAAQEIAGRLTEQAREHHLWNPVTGLTEAMTEAGIVAEEADYIDIALTVDTDYAVFLELAHEGKFAWLWPAVEYLAATGVITDILRKHLGQIKI
jgi:hypothetical protein